VTSILIGIIFIIVAMVIVAVYRGLQIRQLAELGVSATGTVEKVWHHTGATGTGKYRMRYKFTASDGKAYQRSIMISAGEREQYTQGSQVEIIYLNNKPTVNGLASLVNQAKNALKK